MLVRTLIDLEPDEESWGEGHDRWKSSLAQAFCRRIEDRQTWLSQLHSDLREINFESHEERTLSSDEIDTIKPDGLVFDDVTPFLRQHMPPFTVSIPSHQEARAEMRGMLQAIANLEILGNDLLSWQIATRGRAWLERDMSIVRSRYKVG